MTSSWLKVFLTVALQVSPSWLDTHKDWTWSDSELHRGRREGFNPKCDLFGRMPGTRAERLLWDNGWRLSGPSDSRSTAGLEIEIAYAYRSFDGMCRPEQFQAFVFVNENPMGTLSPDLMNSRGDDALTKVEIMGGGEIRAEYARYDAGDPRCCPSRRSVARFSIATHGNRFTLKLLGVETRATPQ
jgi:hypothetical protein